MKKLLLIVSLFAAASVEAQQPSPQPPAQPQQVPQSAAQGKPVGLPPLPSPFPVLLDNAIPLTPDQVTTIRQKQDQIKRAASDPAKTPPKPRIRNINVDLSPGSTPPVVRLAVGNGAGAGFMDSTGAPWPITAIDLANKEDFSAALSVPGTNVVTLNATSEYGNGNMLVFLKDYSTPIVISLFSGQQDVDYRVDLRMPARGPNAQPEPIPVDPNAGFGAEATVKFSQNLGDVLDGIIAPTLKPVNVNGKPGLAWRSGNRLLLRTTYTLMSPAPIQMTASQDGTRAYELEYTPQVLVSSDGRLLSLKISD